MEKHHSSSSFTTNVQQKEIPKYFAARPQFVNEPRAHEYFKKHPEKKIQMSQHQDLTKDILHIHDELIFLRNMYSQELQYFETVNGFYSTVNRHVDIKLRAFHKVLGQIDSIHNLLDKILYDKILLCPPLLSHHNPQIHHVIKKKIHETKHNLQNAWLEFAKVFTACFVDYDHKKKDLEQKKMINLKKIYPPSDTIPHYSIY